MTEAGSTGAVDIDRRTTVILGTALLCLWGARFGDRIRPDDWQPLATMCFWSATQIVFYLVVPLTVLTAVGVRPGEIGWRFRGTATQWTKYAALFAVAVPFVLAASYSGEFQERYPLLDVVPGQTGVWGDLAVWWVFYAVQFVAVETFFRGVLVIGLAPRLGRLAVPLATVPYLMIHFVKPPAEALASIVGGLVMGTLALRTRTVWWGVALHVAVAATMDVLSLGQKGFVW